MDRATQKLRADMKRHVSGLSDKRWALVRAQRKYAPTETPLADAYSRAIAALEALQEELYRVLLWESIPEEMRQKLGISAQGEEERP